MMKLLIGSIKTQEITPMVVLELMSLGAKLFLLVHQDLSNFILLMIEAIIDGFFFIKRKDHISGQFLIISEGIILLWLVLRLRLF